MSKITEQLKNLQEKTETKNLKIDDPNKGYFSEHLAKTYFPGSNGPVKNSLKPAKKRFLQKADIFLIASLVILVLGAVLFIIYGRNFINKPLSITQSREDVTMGRFDKTALETFFIYGDSGNGSGWTDNRIILVNGRNNSWANLTLKLKTPIDLTNRFLTFKARGMKGSERLIVAFADKYNRPNPIEDSVVPFPEGLTTQWRQVKIALKRNSIGFDPTIISKIRFEFGTKKAENQPGATIYLTDLDILEK